MPTDAPSLAADSNCDPLAARRILRLALGTGLCLFFSQAVNWPISFLAPVVTLFLLSLPLPVLKLKQGLGLLILLLLPVCLGVVLLLPLLDNARWAGILLLTLALFYSFLFTARGGSAAVGSILTIGLTLLVTVGSVSLDILLMVIQGLAIGVSAGLIFVWIAHALLPDPPGEPGGPPPSSPPFEAPTPGEAQRSAFRSLVIVMPVTLILLFSGNSASYIALMIKTASMGQQASTDHSRAMGHSLLASTFWGGLGAVIAWQWLLIWPSLILYVLIITIAALLYGSRIFQGKGLHPQGQMWSYAFLTMVVILAPAVLDSLGGSTAGASFYSRLLLFGVIAVYGNISVAVFDAFFGKPEKPS